MNSDNIITIPYTPRPIWRDVLHKELDKHRFSVLVAHRRFGKTVGAINQIIKRALINNLPSPIYAYIAPFRNQAKKIAWSYLKYYTSVIPNVKVNESDLVIELPSLHKGRDGAKIYIIGADNPDALRGLYFDGVILDEYAQIKGNIFGEILRPALADRGGWAIFIGTPHGQNQFYEIYKKALATDGWYTAKYRADETGVLSDEEINAIKQEIEPEEFRQEMLCDFSASNFNVLIPIDLVSNAVDKHINESDYRHSPLIFGLDVARFGNDSSCLCIRRGKVVYQLHRFKGLDNMDLASQIAFLINDKRPDAVFVDSGRGEGVIDRLKQLGMLNIIEVNFGSSPINSERYLNKRAEMWAEIRNFLKDGGTLPNDSDLKTELTAVEYSITEQGKLKLESKEKIKEKIGRSTDGADSLALTFAQPVIPRQMQDLLGQPFARRR